MADRPRAAAASIVSRRLVAPDSFRWLKLLLGTVFFGVAAYMLWAASWNGLLCHDEHCVLRQEFVLRSTEAFPFDARNAPLVVVEDATIGRNGRGRELLLRYPAIDVALMRGWPADVEQEARRLRSYLAAPTGTYALSQPRELFPVTFTAVAALFGLLVLLDGATLGGWRRVRVNPERHAIEIDRFILGLRVKREEHAVSQQTKIGRVLLHPTRPSLAMLTLEEPGSPPRSLGIRDTPKSRAVLEEVLAAQRGVAV